VSVSGPQGAGADSLFREDYANIVHRNEVLMNVQQPIYMDKSAFFAWAEGREGRYELAGGQVVMMTGGTVWHASVVANVFELLRQKLDRKRWTVWADFGVDVGPHTVRYPDVVVDRPGAKGLDRTAHAPALVVEVLSPSTTKTDFGDKAAEYVRLPSLDSYLIVAQDEVKAWLYVRHSNQFLAPEIVEGRSKSITIPSLELVLSLTDIYDGVELD
jgi:Uma2 family endonuclease